MHQRGVGDETVGRIIVQAGKIERTQGDNPVERQLYCTGCKHRVPPIYSKLGVTGRAELRAVLRSMPGHDDADPA